MIEDQRYEVQARRAEVGVAKAFHKPLADFIKKMREAPSKARHVISQVFGLGGEREERRRDKKRSRSGGVM